VRPYALVRISLCGFPHNLSHGDVRFFEHKTLITKEKMCLLKMAIEAVACIADRGSVYGKLAP